MVNCGHLWSFVVKFPSMRIPQMSGFNLVWLCTTRKKMVFDKNYHTLTFLSITFSENHDLLGILEDAILTCGLLWSFVVNCGQLWLIVVFCGRTKFHMSIKTCSELDTSRGKECICDRFGFCLNALFSSNNFVGLFPNFTTIPQIPATCSWYD